MKKHHHQTPAFQLLCIILVFSWIQQLKNSLSEYNIYCIWSRPKCIICFFCLTHPILSKNANKSIKGPRRKKKYNWKLIWRFPKKFIFFFEILPKTINIINCVWKIEKNSLIDADNLFAELIEAKTTKLGGKINDFSNQFSCLDRRLNMKYEIGHS